MIIFLTGAGARGPKPSAVMPEWKVPIAVAAPNQTPDARLLAALEGRPETRIAVQELGNPTPEPLEGLRARGAEVTTVPVYQ